MLSRKQKDNASGGVKSLTMEGSGRTVLESITNNMSFCPGKKDDTVVKSPIFSKFQTGNEVNDDSQKLRFKRKWKEE